MRERAKSQKLSRDEFVSLYKEFSERRELVELFTTYSADDATMTTSELSEFFLIEQRQSLTEDQLTDIVERSEQCPKLRAERLISRVGFVMQSNLFAVLARDAQAKQTLIITQRLSVHLSVHNSLSLQHGEYGIPLFCLFVINSVLLQTFCHDQSVP